MSSAEVKTRFLTEEQLREAKQEDERRGSLASLPRGNNRTGRKGYRVRNG